MLGASAPSTPPPKPTWSTEPLAGSQPHLQPAGASAQELLTRCILGVRWAPTLSSGPGVRGQAGGPRRLRLAGDKAGMERGTPGPKGAGDKKVIRRFCGVSPELREPRSLCSPGS